MRCVSDWRQTNDKCPLGCSSPFLVQPIHDIMLDFHCPYDPSQCSIPIGCLRDFDLHHTLCPFVPPEEIHSRRLKAEYRCLKGHQLEFYLGSY
jgi:hypothetical protein